MRIIIENLPDSVSEEGVRKALAVFAPVEAIRLYKNSGTPSALIEMEMAQPYAEELARRINGHIFKGRALHAWVPIMDWK